VEFIDTTTFLSASRRTCEGSEAALDGGKMEQIHPIFCHFYPVLSIFDMGNNYPFLIWETT